MPLCQIPLQSPGKQRLPVCPHSRPLTIDGVTKLTEQLMNVPSQNRAANLSDKGPYAGIQHYTQSSLDIYSEWIVMK